MFDKIVAIIPAYNPDHELVKVVKCLHETGCNNIVVVNDGSCQKTESVFKELSNENVVILDHQINCGKGASLKTAFSYILNNNKYLHFSGVVTIDADGQHLVSDVKRVIARFLEKPTLLVLGSRNFNQNVPVKSKIGNMFTRSVFKVFTGRYLQDTQTGLRVIPMHFLKELMGIKAKRYEFELEMLIKACYKKQMPIEEVNIDTIYIDNNTGSNFQPVKDSIAIYSVFFKYIIYFIIMRFKK